MATLTNRESLVEEAVYFRTVQFQQGLLQFTDSTNAYRMEK